MSEAGADAEPLPVADPDPFVDPEAQMLSAELVETIQDGLDALPYDQCLALVLVDVQGLSYEEVAAATDSNLGTVKSRINRARAKMRIYLREQGILPSGEQSAREERSNSEYRVASSE